MLKTAGTEHMSPAEFTRHFDALKPGEHFVYLRGYLFKARQVGRRAVHYPEMIEVADAALRLSDRELACLTQKRLADDLYEYRCTKRDR